MSDRLILLDGNNLMHRAYHALPLMDNRPDDARDKPVEGEYTYTNALHGFLMMLFKVMEDWQPRWICAAFDDHGPTFRHKEYDAYKAGRKPTPDELRPQMTAIRELLPELGVKVAHLEGFEADDLMGTLSLKARGMGIQTLIVSGDRDILQLTDDTVNVLYIKQGIRDTILYNPEEIDKKYGIPAPRIADMKGLMGDASDNIPGVPGIGEKTALKLLKEYGALEDVLANADKVKGKLGEKLREFKEQAEFSKRLATIDRNAPYPLNLDECALFEGGADKWDGDGDALPLDVSERGRELLHKYGLNAALKRLGTVNEPKTHDVQRVRKLITVNSNSEWQDAVKTLAETRAVYLEESAGIRKLSAADNVSEVLYEIARASEPEYDLMQLAVMTDSQRASLDAAADAKPDYSLPEGRYISHDIKRMWHEGFEVEFEFDTMLGAYLLDSSASGGFELAALRKAISIPDEATSAAAIYDLAEKQRARMTEEGSLELYNEVELPFAHVLLDMERQGFGVDSDALRKLGGVYEQRIAELEQKIHALADEEAAGRYPAGEFDNVNLMSPKQLGEMLFDKLGMKVGGAKPRKTQRGYSTDADTLEALADEHEIAGAILEYRKYTKLNGTYIQGLLKQVARGGGEEAGRIHTSFDQVATATGRISSLEPNLQNIPVRTELGREIRGAFVARGPQGDSEEWVLVDGDYSQIELRVLAHMAEHGRPEGERAMQRAFVNGLDIHAATAGEVFDTPYDEVTKQQRSAAKAVNFGIVYGISDFGLARNLGTSRARAKEYIERYKERYPGISEFMDAQVRAGYELGYVKTLMGRRRYLPQLKSSNYNLRSFGERAAMNSPIQGTAADIIKLAMVKVSAALKAAGLRARLILQVHDEIIIEAPVSEAAQVADIMRAQMSGAVRLDVPLDVDISQGHSWMDCK